MTSLHGGLSDVPGIPAPTDAAFELLRDLVRIPSPSGGEGAVADTMQRFLERHGLRTSREGRNVWCRVEGPDSDSPVLLLNSHLDTVAPVAGWVRDPYDPAVEDGVLYGLGCNDAGGALCAMAAATVAASGMRLPYTLVFAATAEEETAGPGGIDRVLPMLGRIDAALVGEPTGMRLAVAERGLLVIDAEAHGVAGHAARRTGVNAIDIAMRDIAWVQSHDFGRPSPMLGGVTATVTQISAGTQHNVVPDRCRFVIDVRVPDTFTLEEVLDIIRDGMTSEATPRSLRLRPSFLPDGHPLMHAACALGIDCFGSPTLSDQARIPVPSAKMGPGASERSHTADEYLREEEFRHGVDTYVRLLRTLRLEHRDETVG